jgi:hypothetical protein
MIRTAKVMLQGTITSYVKKNSAAFIDPKKVKGAYKRMKRP